MGGADDRGGPCVDLLIEDPGWDAALPDLARHAETAFALACRGAGRDPARHTLSLLACDDARIAALNAEFRGKAAATNVLAWPAADPVAPEPGPDGPPLFLGDVAIALGTTAREAEAGGLTLKEHAIHLILHASLHCLGFDHETERSAGVMEGIETRALAAIGIADPYCRGGAEAPHPD